MSRIENLKKAIRAIENCEDAPTGALAFEIRRVIGERSASVQDRVFSLQGSRDLVEAIFPGWWYRSGWCGISGDADIGPDYHRAGADERMIEEFPPALFDGVFAVDLQNNGHLIRERESMAIVHCILHALLRVEQMNAGILRKDGPAVYPWKAISEDDYGDVKPTRGDGWYPVIVGYADGDECTGAPSGETFQADALEFLNGSWRVEETWNASAIVAFANERYDDQDDAYERAEEILATRQWAR
ncbi:hypothetical protein [Methylosinus sp. PW1]|uniref:hypothetical protein n=1 Tax=Methylosinus sp. PW1 TaxID=107636 RepID=UPI00055DCF45|nr:hypothetical protein [Methylosinus sp. PW1]